ncbi:hypothetical protein TNCV_2950361 [Trichonephila clavipes]|nr:hypothetical protein TNCV_4752821 [Trichonephila clavipes]GFV00668.1 hypothetical protein TNCV_2950361 [Trichonephila clavipes]
MIPASTSRIQTSQKIEASQYCSIHPETMAHRKYLSPNEIANLFQGISDNESGGGGLSCSCLDPDENIRLSESDCKESE